MSHDFREMRSHLPHDVAAAVCLKDWPVAERTEQAPGVVDGISRARRALFEQVVGAEAALPCTQVELFDRPVVLEVAAPVPVRECDEGTADRETTEAVSRLRQAGGRPEAYPAAEPARARPVAKPPPVRIQVGALLSHSHRAFRRINDQVSSGKRTAI